MPPRESRFSEPNDAAIREIAARWIVRRDRGLTAEERAEYEQWRAADLRHAVALARASLAWELLDHVPESATVMPSPTSLRQLVLRRWPVVAGLAAAIAIGGIFLASSSRSPAPAMPAAAQLAPTSARPAPVTADTQHLPDGTIVRLGSDSHIVEEFSASERLVRLVRGEAYFTVTTDLKRPFLVQAGEVTVRAVGTAFNVQLQSHSVEVLVAEGTVQVAQNGTNPSPSDPSPESPLVEAGHRAVVSLAPETSGPRVVVSALPAEELAEALAQRERMLRLSGATLVELVAEFGRRTGTRVIIADPALEQLRIGGRFRGDDVEGFVRVLESSYGIRSRRAADGSIVLGKRP
jgi:transmembrane sensor